MEDEPVRDQFQEQLQREDAREEDVKLTQQLEIHTNVKRNAWNSLKKEIYMILMENNDEFKKIKIQII